MILKNFERGNSNLCIRIILLSAAQAPMRKKFYFNQDFNALQDHVKERTADHVCSCTEDVGGILTLELTKTADSVQDRRGFGSRCTSVGLEAV